MPATTYNIRNLVGQSGAFNYQRPWQKRVAIDNSGNVYTLSFDKNAGLAYMYLNKFNGTSYSQVFSLLIGDVNKNEEGSMIFDSTRQILHITYTYDSVTGTREIRYNKWSLIDNTWMGTAETVYTSSLSYALKEPDICLDNFDHPHIGFIYDYIYYTYRTTAWQSPIGLSIIGTTDNSISLACNLFNQICVLYTNSLSQTTNYFYFKIYPAQSYSAFSQTSFTGFRLGTISIDNINDIHIICIDNLNRLCYFKFDYSSNSISITEVLVASANWNYAEFLYGITLIWDYTNNCPDVYVFYGTGDDIHTLKYIKRTGSTGTWGSAVTCDSTRTAVRAVNSFKGFFPSTILNTFFMAIYEDNDGATPYPEIAWHSITGPILNTGPTPGGHYSRGRVRGGNMIAVDIDKFAFQDISQYPREIISVCQAVEGSVNTGEDPNDTTIFATGRDIKEYNINKFSDDGEPINCCLEKGNIDFGDVSKRKSIDSIIAYYDSDTFDLILSNEKGAVRKINFDRDDSGEIKSVNFKGNVFKFIIVQTGTTDFKFNSIEINASSSEL